MCSKIAKQLTEIMKLWRRWSTMLKIIVPQLWTQKCQTPVQEWAEPWVAFTMIWWSEFYQAVDLVSVEQNRRFHQKCMIWAVNQERAIIIMAAEGGTDDLEPLQLPKVLDIGHLDLQLKMLGEISMWNSERCSIISISSPPSNKSLQSLKKLPLSSSTL